MVAHPDDETIWCGGLILRRPDWQWTVLSLCRADDDDRRERFGRACRRLGARAIISDLDDGAPLAPLDGPRDIGRRILRHAGGRRWGLVLTHGANGEYGHQRHREVHDEVLRLAAGGELPHEDLWTFAYDCAAATGRCVPQADATVRIDLTEAQLAGKRRIIHDTYGFGEEAFECRACISPEAFRRHSPGPQGELP
ncbi:MAG: PIG-L family deacetylase [Planctomycetes bacterium]|nr:PIG-L family deacetylase [Planctomycetota bacterium]